MPILKLVTSIYDIRTTLTRIDNDTPNISITFIEESIEKNSLIPLRLFFVSLKNKTPHKIKAGQIAIR